MKKRYISPFAKIVNIHLRGSILYEPGVVGHSPVTDISVSKRNNFFDEEGGEERPSWNVWNSYDD